MAAIINKQPVFTTSPILKVAIKNPTIVTNATSPPDYLGDGDIIFNSTDDFGSLIERITVSSTATPANPNVNEKLIYLYLFDKDNEVWSLYRTATMPATTVSNIIPNAEIEWVFTGGIILPLSFRFYIGASRNYDTNSYPGDYLSITVEGSTYTQL